MITLGKSLFNRLKPFIFAYLLSLFFVFLFFSYLTGLSFSLLEHIGKAFLISLFLLIGLEVQIVVLLYFNKKIIIEVYSTVLSIFGVIGLISVATNGYSDNEKMVLIPIMLTITIVGLINRFVVSKLDQTDYRQAKKRKNDLKNNKKIVI